MISTQIEMSTLANECILLLHSTRVASDVVVPHTTSAWGGTTTTQQATKRSSATDNRPTWVQPKSSAGPHALPIETPSSSPRAGMGSTAPKVFKGREGGNSSKRGASS